MRGQRLDPLGLDRRLIHAAAVEVSDLAFVRARGGGWRGDELVQNLVERIEVSQLERVGASPARLIAGNRVALEPSAISVLIEVRTSGGRGVHVGGIEAVCLRRVGRRGRLGRGESGQTRKGKQGGRQD